MPFVWTSQGKALEPPQVDLPTIVWCQRRGHWSRSDLDLDCYKELYEIQAAIYGANMLTMLKELW